MQTRVENHKTKSKKVKNTERAYIGFYTLDLFWVDSQPDLTDFRNQTLNDVAIYEIGDDLQIRIRKDGLFLFTNKTINQLIQREREKSEPDLDKVRDTMGIHTDYLNALYLLFQISLKKYLKKVPIKLKEITGQDLLLILFDQHRNVEIFGDIRSHGLMVSYALHQSFQDPDVVKVIMPFFIDRQIIPQSVFKDMSNNFCKINDKPERVRLLSMLAKSISEYKVGNYATALVLAWVVIEWHLNKYWEKLLNDLKKDQRLKRKRKDILENGTSFTASVAAEIFEMLKIIPFNIYEFITDARKKRNFFVHKRIHIESNDCKNAYKAACWFIKQDLGLDLFLDMQPPGIGLSSSN